MNKTRRNIIIAVILLAVLLVIPFWPRLKGEGGEAGAQATCTVAVSCQPVLEDMERLDEEKTDLIPADGWLLEETEVSVPAGGSVLDALRGSGLEVETAGSPPYVTGIGGLASGDAGDLSGWTYTVNGESVMTGCDELAVNAGDQIVWTYVVTWE